MPISVGNFEKRDGRRLDKVNKEKSSLLELTKDSSKTKKVLGGNLEVWTFNTNLRRRFDKINY